MLNDLITQYEFEKLTLINLKSKIGAAIALSPETLTKDERIKIVEILSFWKEA